MKKQKKQNLLTVIIIILVITLVMMVGSIVYEEMINMNKQPIQNTSAPAVNESINDGNDGEDDEEEQIDETIVVEDESEEILENDSEEEAPSAETGNQEEFVGEEENKTQKEPEMTTDEKAIDLVKKEWGNDDSVTFSIEKKNGSKYRVAVRDNSTTVLAWYEVDIETWKVSEY